MKIVKKIFKNKKGITLIALVITIVVLLILAGVSIAMLTGENGILTQATRAKEESRIAAILEEWSMIKTEILISKNTDTSIITKDQMASRLSNVGMTPTEINTLIMQEGSVKLNDKTTLKYSDLGLGTPEVVSLEGKSALFVGDSVAYGSGNSGKAWSYYINNEYKLSNCNNVAVPGASWTYDSTTSTSRIINQYKNDSANYDFVILEGGINDLTYGSTWGEISDSKTIVENSKIITEAMDEAFNTAITKWPNARIGYILLYNTEDSGRSNHATQLDEYHDLIISICNKWNIPVFDMYAGTVIDNNKEVSFDELLDVHNKTYLEDGLHLNDAGYEKTYKYIAGWMMQLPKIHQTEDETDGKWNNLLVVNNISDLNYTANYQILQENGSYYSPAYNKTGRAASVGYILKVNGGETIQLNTSNLDISYAIYEFNNSGTSSGGQTASGWLTGDLTLNSNTRYVSFYIKKNNEIDFTDDELKTLKTCLNLHEVETEMWNGLSVTTTFNDLEYTANYQILQENGSYSPAYNKTGRAASVGYILKVNGGETIQLNTSNLDISYAIYEFNNSATSSGGQIVSGWLTGDLTLNSSTRYVSIYIKKNNEVDFTDDELKMLKNCLSFK